MKKPDKTISPENSILPRADTPPDAHSNPTPSSPAGQPAAPGIIAQTPIQAGKGTTMGLPTDDGSPGKDIRPIKSTLLGDGKDQAPAAVRKPLPQDPAFAAASGDHAKRNDHTTGQKGVPKDDSKDAAQKNVTQKEDVQKDGLQKDKVADGRGGDLPNPNPAPTAAANTAGQQTVVRKTGFWPVVFGGVVAAGLGSAATIWALPHLPDGWVPSVTAEQTAPQIDQAALRADAVNAAQAALGPQIERQIAQRIDALQAGTGDADGTVADLRRQIEEQAAQIQGLAARPQIDPDMAARVQSLASEAGTLEQQLQVAAEAAQSQINAAQAEAERLQQAAAESTRRAEAVAAVASLQIALDRGISPDQARRTLENAGLEAPEALNRQVPSLTSLQSGFPEAARAALRAALPQESAAGNGSLFSNFLRAQTGARSVVARDGTDPDAILSRANEAVNAGRIGDAVNEAAALPDGARTAPAMAEWLAGATTYQDAQAALSDLSAPAN